jgi:AraC-like DNA-binding protein
MFAGIAEALRKICNLINMRYRDKHKNFELSVVKYIDDNITNPNLYIKMVTTSFRISENRLQTIVRQWTGKSFLEYVESKRMALAREMLLKTPKPITQIYRECGYSSENSFYKAFRRFYKQTPSEIRR